MRLRYFDNIDLRRKILTINLVLNKRQGNTFISNKMSHRKLSVRPDVFHPISTELKDVRS